MIAQSGQQVAALLLTNRIIAKFFLKSTHSTCTVLFYNYLITKLRKCLHKWSACSHTIYDWSKSYIVWLHGYWSIRGQTNSWTSQLADWSSRGQVISRTGQFADKPSRGLVNSRTISQLADASTRLKKNDVIAHGLLQELVEDVAVATSSRHADLSWALRFAVASLVRDSLTAGQPPRRPRFWARIVWGDQPSVSNHQEWLHGVDYINIILTKVTHHN